MNRQQRRMELKALKHKTNRSRVQMNNYFQLEFETFETIERLFEMMRNGSLLWDGKSWVIMGQQGVLVDITYSLGWWLRYWKTIANRAGKQYDDTAMVRLLKSLEYHKPLTIDEVNKAYDVVKMQRWLYRNAGAKLVSQTVDELKKVQEQEEMKELLRKVAA